MLCFSGAHVRSHGAIRSFWFFTLITILVDLLWLLVYSPLRPIAWDTLLSLSRKDQLSVMISVLNTCYKGVVVWTAIALQGAFTAREALISQIELEAGVGRGATGSAASPATTSSGEPLDARSLAAQAQR